MGHWRLVKEGVFEGDYDFVTDGNLIAWVAFDKREHRWKWAIAVGVLGATHSGHEDTAERAMAVALATRALNL